MNITVDPGRFLSVECEPDERIVFDRIENRYHLLRESAARLWEEIGDGGSFEVGSEEQTERDLFTRLADAGLVRLDAAVPATGIPRRVWLRRTGRATAAALVLPLVATVAVPRLGLAQDGPSLEVENGVPSTDTASNTGSNSNSSSTEETTQTGDLTPEERRARKQARRGGEPEVQDLEEPAPSTPERTRRRDRNPDPGTTQPTTESSTGTQGADDTRTRSREHWSDQEHWSEQDHWSQTLSDRAGRLGDD